MNRDVDAGCVEALAEAWASMDGKADRFRVCANDPAMEAIDGTYCGYTCEAVELLTRLGRRGYRIVRS